VLEFVDEHGTEVLNLGSFTLLPQHVVRLILVREELKADEFTKFQVCHSHWSIACCNAFFVCSLRCFPYEGCLDVGQKVLWQ